MKTFRSLLCLRKNTARRAAVPAAILVVLFATAALGDEIDDSLPPDSPQAVKASARRAIQSGLARKDVVKLTGAMLQNKFDEQQVQLAHALMIEAKNSDMPVQPLMNKAFEGMAKSVDPSLIVGAMETVHSRNAFAYRRAARLSENKSRTANLGRPLSDALAAGFSKEDAGRITKMLQQNARSINSDQAYSLALECFTTARDVSRLGVSSSNVTDMLTNALHKGFDHQGMRAMRNSFMTAARRSDARELARSYAAAIREGRGYQEGPGVVGGEGSDGGGHGASGSGGSGSGSGPGGGGSRGKQ